MQSNCVIFWLGSRALSRIVRDDDYCKFATSRRLYLARRVGRLPRRAIADGRGGSAPPHALPMRRRQPRRGPIELHD